jgi:hypothetical protein
MLEEAELIDIPHLIGRRKATPQREHKLLPAPPTFIINITSFNFEHSCGCFPLDR